MKSTLFNIAQEAEKCTIENGLVTRHRVDVLIINEQKQILAYTHPGDGIPEVPGGGLDQNEDTVTAAHRETMEESGWEIKDVLICPYSQETYYKAEDLDWIKQNGFDQEKQLFVFAKPVAFNPNHLYASEGDAKQFQWISITDFVKQTQEAILKSDNPQWKFQAHLRTMVLLNHFS